MGQWLHDNASVISAVTNVAMVAIWLGYLQLFYRQFRRSQMPQMMILESDHHTLNADCLLVNMSQEIVTLVTVMVAARGPEGEQLSEITGYQQKTVEERSPRQLEEVIKQGPMDSGMFLRLGSFRDLLDIVARDGLPQKEVESLEIRAVVVHGAYPAPIGACRQYDLQRDEEGRLLGARATTDTTDQLRSWRRRRTVKSWLGAIR